MAIVQKVRAVHSRFGFTGVIATTVAKILRKPVRMKVLPPGLEHYVHLRARTSDLFVYDAVLVQKQYQCDLPFEPRVIIDAGAHIGLTSAYFADMYPNARIVAIEPEPENFRLLERNIAPYKNVRTIRAALCALMAASA